MVSVGELCHTKFPQEELLDIILQFLNMSHEELVTAMFKMPCIMQVPITNVNNRTRKKNNKTPISLHAYIHRCFQIYIDSNMCQFSDKATVQKTKKKKNRLPFNSLKLKHIRAAGDFILS